MVCDAMRRPARGKPAPRASRYGHGGSRYGGHASRQQQRQLLLRGRVVGTYATAFSHAAVEWWRRAVLPRAVAPDGREKDGSASATVMGICGRRAY